VVKPWNSLPEELDVVMSPGTGIKEFEAGLGKFLNDQPMKFCYKEELHILTPGPGRRGSYPATVYADDNDDYLR